jgi:TetR/AcrR family fatty acid metabolism transcriptional regulator
MTQRGSNMRAPKQERNREALADRRRKQILTAAVRLFAKHGFHETEIDSIAKGAGVSKGTIYNYFDDKRALFMAAIEWGFELLAARIGTAVGVVEDPVRKLETAMQTYLSFFQSNGNLYRLLFLHRGAYRDATELRSMKRHIAHLSLFEGILTEGIERGAFRRIDVRVGSFAIAGIIHAHYHQWRIEGKGRKLLGDVSPVKNLVFSGLVIRNVTRPEHETAPPA